MILSARLPGFGDARRTSGWNPAVEDVLMNCDARVSVFAEAQENRAASQLLNCGSWVGSAGCGPLGSPRSIQKSSEWSCPPGKNCPPMKADDGGIGSGREKSSLGSFFRASCRNALHIGTAARMLDPCLCIAVLSLFPAHTPTTSDGVYPIAHASR